MVRKKIRLAVAGVGPRGLWMLKLFRANSNYSLVGICDRFVNKAETAAQELNLGCEVVFENYEAMLADCKMDAVFIAAPPDIQVNMACTAMRRGIHVATEVPAALNIEDCWNLVNCVKETGMVYQLMEQTRYWGFIQKWRNMSLNGKFGKILYAEGEYMHYMEWDYFFDKETGETLYGSPYPPKNRDVEETWRYRVLKHPIYYLPHTLSPLLSITQGRVKSVCCMGTRPNSYYVEGYPGRDIEVALMKLDNDCIIKVAASFLSPHGPRKETGFHWYQVMGTKMTVEWARSNKDKPRMWGIGDRDWREMDWSTYVENSNDFIRKSGHAGVDAYPVEKFAEALLLGVPVEMDVYRAVETAAPAILAAESAEKDGMLIGVPDFR